MFDVWILEFVLSTLLLSSSLWPLTVTFVLMQVDTVNDLKASEIDDVCLVVIVEDLQLSES